MLNGRKITKELLNALDDAQKPLSAVDRIRCMRREQRKARSKELTATIAKDSRPLILKELRQMVDWPVWVEVLDHDVFADPADDFDSWGMVRESWVRIWDAARADLIHIDYDFESYGKEWRAYAMPISPEQAALVAAIYKDVEERNNATAT